MSDDGLERLASEWERLAAISKAAERAYVIPGLDLPWWQPRPPSRAWRHEGVFCALAPGVMSSMNGYVLLPEGHPWHELDLQGEDCNVADAPGGITFGPHVTGWIGFDTAHAFDFWSDEALTELRAYVPDDVWASWERTRAITGLLLSRRYPWTLARIIGEVHGLAEQVAGAG